jgi:hypothetical protein
MDMEISPSDDWPQAPEIIPIAAAWYIGPNEPEKIPTSMTESFHCEKSGRCWSSLSNMHISEWHNLDYDFPLSEQSAHQLWEERSVFFDGQRVVMRASRRYEHKDERLEWHDGETFGLYFALMFEKEGRVEISVSDLMHLHAIEGDEEVRRVREEHASPEIQSKYMNTGSRHYERELTSV